VAAFLAQLRQVRELKSRGRGEDHQAWESEKAGPWKPSAALLGRSWQAVRPLAQKAKDAALRASGAILSSPRRLLWGLGLAVLAVVLIWAGVRLNRKAPEVPPTAPVAAVKAPAAVLSGQPLTESQEPAAPGEQPAVGLAPAPAPAPVPALRPPAPATVPEGAKDKEGRYMLVAGTFANQKQAQALQQKLIKDKFKAKIVSRTSGGKTQYQVQIGPVTGAKAAEDLSQRLKSKEKITPRVMKMADKTKPTKPATKSTTRRTSG
jgi:cell division septation protein DedD